MNERKKERMSVSGALKLRLFISSLSDVFIKLNLGMCVLRQSSVCGWVVGWLGVCVLFRI